MSRKPGPSKHKLELIMYALHASPHGTWVRDIAKKTGMKKSTVAYYLNNHLSDKIDIVHDSKHIKLVKLKEKEKKERKMEDDDSGEEQPTEEPQDLEDVPDYIG